jgi:hypothetical protein
MAGTATCGAQALLQKTEWWCHIRLCRLRQRFSLFTLWKTRAYANRSGFPQVIHSAKRFSGPTGLEEHVGCGISMLLKVIAEPRGIVFKSAGYQLKIGHLRLSLPRFLSPGDVTVTHMETEGERFIFEMTLCHPWLGELIHQSAEYGDVVQ